MGNFLRDRARGSRGLDWGRGRGLCYLGCTSVCVGGCLIGRSLIQARLLVASSNASKVIILKLQEYLLKGCCRLVYKARTILYNSCVKGCAEVNEESFL